MRVNSIVWGIISGQVGRLVAVALRRRMPLLASAQDSARTLSAALTVGACCEASSAAKQLLKTSRQLSRGGHR
jgi:hypothetical protein